MPLFEQRWALEVAEKVSAFLDLRMGLVRGPVPARDGRPGELAELVAERDALRAEVRGQRERLARKDGRIAELEGGAHGPPRPRLEPERLIFIFGSGRSGTTWLRDMMAGLPGFATWEEPRVGELFGEFYERAGPRKLGAKNFIIGEPYREVWLRSLREMVLDGAAARFPGLPVGGRLVVKEPNGSVGAPLLSEALPESGMICVLRDPRDVCSSVLDGARQGGWHFERVTDDARWKIEREADLDPDAFIRRPAEQYLRNAGGALRAYRSHPGPKILIRYEELTADTIGTLGRVFSALGVPVAEGDLARVAREHSWENIPEERRGGGKFYRKATPGAWREDLTPRQAEIVEEITAPLLGELYGE